MSNLNLKIRILNQLKYFIQIYNYKALSEHFYEYI